jgi:lipase ATG15
MALFNVFLAFSWVDLAALIGLSFGAPVVAFEAPGEKMAAKRLHLPMPPGMPTDKMGITHVYNNADPIPMGLCVGPYSKLPLMVLSKHPS